ncbi:MAG TPA: hypothetical protein VGS12_17715 [Caulobacteraceae bacterium]|nr:hypothetical protein [Caulobacteraceae bacterium]
MSGAPELVLQRPALEAAVSKAAFAKLIGVSRTRISQYCREGRLGPEVFEGEGRQARIRVAVALQQLASRLDPGQRLGNGLGTRLDGADARSAPAPPDEVGERLKATKLERDLLALARAKEEALARRGVLMRAADVRAGYSRAVVTVISAFEGGLGELAQRISAQFKAPPRDALHLARSWYRDTRTKAAAAVRGQVDAAPKMVEVDLDELEAADRRG